MNIDLSSSAVTVFPDANIDIERTPRSVRLPITRPLYALEVGPISADFKRHAQKCALEIMRMVPWARIVFTPRLLIKHPLRPDVAALHGVFHEMTRLKGFTLPYRATTIIVADQDMQSLYRSTMAACWQAMETELNPALIRMVMDDLTEAGIIDPTHYPAPIDYRKAGFATFALAAVQGFVPEPETVAEHTFAEALSGDLGTAIDRYRDTTTLPA